MLFLKDIKFAQIFQILKKPVPKREEQLIMTVIMTIWTLMMAAIPDDVPGTTQSTSHVSSPGRISASGWHSLRIMSGSLL